MSVATSFREARRLPPAEAYPHGTRARFVTGCRCASCRAANAATWRQRNAEATALALQLASPAPRPFATDHIRRAWAMGRRLYRRYCAGVDGRPCPTGSHLRKDSKGPICGNCRLRLVWNGLVPTERVLAHVRRLSRLGVGYKSVAAAASISHTTLAKIIAGRRRNIRAQAERRILAVDGGAVADHAHVPAGPTWRLIQQLLQEGFTKTRLARELGSRAKVPSLQLRRGRVLAVTALKVERLWRRYMEVPGLEAAP